MDQKVTLNIGSFLSDYTTPHTTQRHIHILYMYHFLHKVYEAHLLQDPNYFTPCVDKFKEDKVQCNINYYLYYYNISLIIINYYYLC
jgi:hypothetical protein